MLPDGDNVIPATDRAGTGAAGGAAGAYRIYEVKGKHETLRSIAREEMGDSGREDELRELNRAAFEEGSERVRVGMKLRLPTIRR